VLKFIYLFFFLTLDKLIDKLIDNVDSNFCHAITLHIFIIFRMRASPKLSALNFEWIDVITSQLLWFFYDKLMLNYKISHSLIIFPFFLLKVDKFINVFTIVHDAYCIYLPRCSKKTATLYYGFLELNTAKLTLIFPSFWEYNTVQNSFWTVVF